MKYINELKKPLLLALKIIIQLAIMWILIILYFVIYRRSITLSFMANIVNEITSTVFVLIVLVSLPMIFIFIAWVIAYLFSKLNYVYKLSKKKTLFNIVTLFLSFFIITKINYLEYIYANTDISSYPKAVISKNDVDRQTNFYWLKASLSLYTITIFYFDQFEDLQS